VEIDKKSKVFLDACKKHGADPLIISGIITVESTWNPWAYRLEPTFHWTLRVKEFASAEHFTEASERALQKSSFGLMQLMGGTARTLGFNGYLPELFDPEKNLNWGLKLWSRLRLRYPSVEDAIAAYNAGSAKKDVGGTYVNQEYVTKVLRAAG
jgi:hypothetical protein